MDSQHLVVRLLPMHVITFFLKGTPALEYVHDMGIRDLVYSTVTLLRPKLCVSHDSRDTAVIFRLICSGGLTLRQILAPTSISRSLHEINNELIKMQILLYWLYSQRVICSLFRRGHAPLMPISWRRVRV